MQSSLTIDNWQSKIKRDEKKFKSKQYLEQKALKQSQKKSKRSKHSTKSKPNVISTPQNSDGDSNVNERKGKFNKTQTLPRRIAESSSSEEEEQKQQKQPVKKKIKPMDLLKKKKARHTIAHTRPKKVKRCIDSSESEKSEKEQDKSQQDKSQSDKSQQGQGGDDDDQESEKQISLILKRQDRNQNYKADANQHLRSQKQLSKYVESDQDTQKNESFKSPQSDDDDDDDEVEDEEDDQENEKKSQNSSLQIESKPRGKSPTIKRFQNLNNRRIEASGSNFNNELGPYNQPSHRLYGPEFSDQRQQGKRKQTTLVTKSAKKRMINNDISSNETQKNKKRSIQEQHEDSKSQESELPTNRVKESQDGSDFLMSKSRRQNRGTIKLNSIVFQRDEKKKRMIRQSQYSDVQAIGEPLQSGSQIESSSREASQSQRQKNIFSRQTHTEALSSGYNGSVKKVHVEQISVSLNRKSKNKEEQFKIIERSSQKNQNSNQQRKKKFEIEDDDDDDDESQHSLTEPFPCNHQNERKQLQKKMLEIRPNLRVQEFKMDAGFGVVKCGIEDCYNFLEPTQENIALLFTKKEINERNKITGKEAQPIFTAKYSINKRVCAICHQVKDYTRDIEDFHDYHSFCKKCWKGWVSFREHKGLPFKQCPICNFKNWKRLNKSEFEWPVRFGKWIEDKKPAAIMKQKAKCCRIL